MTPIGHPIANGLGPHWFPASWRRVLTKASSFFFDEASWIRHDEGYHKGDPSRLQCDWLFFRAMQRDAIRQPSLWRKLVAISLAVFFWLMVRLFGWMSYKK